VKPSPGRLTRSDLEGEEGDSMESSKVAVIHTPLLGLFMRKIEKETPRSRKSSNGEF
jgi:hypothetical protein